MTEKPLWISCYDVAFNERASLSICPNLTLIIPYVVIVVQTLILNIYPQFGVITYSIQIF